MEDIETDENNALLPESEVIVEPVILDRGMQRFVASVKALEEVLDYESDMLERHQNPDFNDIHARKERALHTFNLLYQENPQIGEESNRALIAQLAAPLRDKLARNEHILKMNLDAVGELVDMLHTAAQARDTDGTYSPFTQNNKP